MEQPQNYDNASVAHTPVILESLCEIEKRDPENKGAANSDRFWRAGMTDPRGYSVMNSTGHDVGEVADLYVDPNTRKPRFAMLRLGNHRLGIGDRRVLVDFDDVAVEGDHHVRIRVTV